MTLSDPNHPKLPPTFWVFLYLFGMAQAIWSSNFVSK